MRHFSSPLKGHHKTSEGKLFINCNHYFSQISKLVLEMLFKLLGSSDLELRTVKVTSATRWKNSTKKRNTDPHTCRENVFSFLIKELEPAQFIQKKTAGVSDTPAHCGCRVPCFHLCILMVGDHSPSCL